jgi:hypothetical protein
MVMAMVEGGEQREKQLVEADFFRVCLLVYCSWRVHLTVVV